jgi:hypothetical protein
VARSAGLALLVACALGLGCAREGEVLTVTASARLPAGGPGAVERGAWGDEIRPGVKAIAVSSDLVERGLVPGVRVRIEGFAGSYAVLDRLPPGRTRHIAVFAGLEPEAARRMEERQVRIYWEAP